VAGGRKVKLTNNAGKLRAAAQIGASQRKNISVASMALLTATAHYKVTRGGFEVKRQARN